MKKLLIIALCIFSTINFLNSQEIIVNPALENNLILNENNQLSCRITNQVGRINYSEYLNEKGNFLRFTLPGYSWNMDYGTPELPVRRKLIEIPLGSNPEIKIISSSFTEIDLNLYNLTKPIYPAQAPQSKSEDIHEFVYNTNAYSTDRFYSNQLVSIDPGETAVITIQVTNTGHSDGVNSQVLLHTFNPYVSITDTMYFIGCLPVGTVFNVLFEITLSENIPLGEEILFDCSFEAGMYLADKTLSSVVGIMVEDFETADFLKFEWQFAGIKDWEITDELPYEGEYCARSGDITHNQSSEIYISMNILSAGEMSFYSKVSSEVDYDFLKFEINGDLKDEWSGEQDWNLSSYAITTGNHKFSWNYIKDGNTSGGSDQAWIDYIIFPPADYITAVNENNEEIDLISVYPNPCTDHLNVGIITRETSSMQIEIIDILGKSILKIDNLKGFSKYTINTSSLNDGIYFIKYTTDNKSSMHKFIHHSR